MLETQKCKETYIVNNDPVFPFPIKFWSPENIICYLNYQGGARLLSPGEYTVQSKPDYSDGADVTLNISPLPTGAKFIIYRLLPIVQLTSLPEYGELKTEPLEAQLDKIAAMIQQLGEGLERTLQAPPGGTVLPALNLKKDTYYVLTAYNTDIFWKEVRVCGVEI